MDSQNSSRRGFRLGLIPVVLVALFLILTGVGLYLKQITSESPSIIQPNESLVLAPPPPSPTASPETQSNTPPPPTQPGAVDLTTDTNGLSKTTALIQTSQGNIRFKFYPKDAPHHVNRIIELIENGFYNGHIFHRVVPGFVIQTGDPTGEGTGGSGQRIKGEFGTRRHIEGTVGMARAQDPDSADSQFYIINGGDESVYRHLNGKYTIFGQVIEGFDVARRIKIGDRVLSIRLE